MTNQSVHLKIHRNFCVREIQRIEADASFAEMKSRWLFYFGFALVVMNRMLDQLALNLDLGFLASLPVLPLALVVLFVRCVGVLLGARLRRVALFLSLLLLGVVSYLRCGQSYLPTACLLLFGIGEIRLKRVVGFVSASVLMLVCGLGIMQFIDWALAGEIAGAVSRSSGKLRLSFFFTHPNTLAALVCMSYIGLSSLKDAFGAANYLSGVILSFLVLLITDSRTSTAILLFYLSLRLIFNSRCNQLRRVVLRLFFILPVFFFVFSAILMLNILPAPVEAMLNVVLNGRPGYWILQYEQLGGWTFLGQQVLIGDQLINGWLYPSVTIDCFYAATLLQLGAWSFFAFYSIYAIAGRRAIKNNDYSTVAALLACVLFGFTEIHMIDLAICLPLLLLGEAFLPKGGTSSKIAGQHSILGDKPVME